MDMESPIKWLPLPENDSIKLDNQVKSMDAFLDMVKEVIDTPELIANLLRLNGFGHKFTRSDLHQSVTQAIAGKNSSRLGIMIIRFTYECVYKRLPRRAFMFEPLPLIAD